MEDQLGKKRQSKKKKNREVRKGATYGQRLQPNQCVSFSATRETDTTLGGEGEEAHTTFTKSGKGMKQQPYSHYVSNQVIHTALIRTIIQDYCCITAILQLFLPVLINISIQLKHQVLYQLSFHQIS